MLYIYVVHSIRIVHLMSVAVVLIIVKIYCIRRARIHINDEVNGGCGARAIAGGFAMI